MFHIKGTIDNRTGAKGVLDGGQVDFGTIRRRMAFDGLAAGGTDAAASRWMRGPS